MPARPTDTPPVLKRDKVRGYFYVRWGGRLFTLGSDEKEARRKFADPHSEHPGALHRWQQWAAAKMARTTSHGARVALSPLVVDLVEGFLDTYADRPDAERYYRKHLARFVTVLGAVRADVIDEQAIEALRADMIARKFAPRTIAHDIKAVKKLWRWSCATYRAPAVPRLELSEIRTPPLDPPTPHPVSRETLRSMLAKARAEDPLLGASVELAYYALLRPTEVVRVIRGEGRFEPIVYPDLRPWDSSDPSRASLARVVPGGLFVLASKVQHRTGAPRYVVLSESGKLSLESVRGLSSGRRSLRKAGKRVRLWDRLDSYSAAVEDATGLRPSVVRDTAASDLHSLGVEWGSIDLLLGHVPSGAGRSYIHIAWHALRDQASRLRL